MPPAEPAATAVDRASLVDWFHRNRKRSNELFDLISPEAFLSRPIPLRHPIVFYEGHIPVFNYNTIVKKGLGGSPIDEGFERVFARGIDPEDEAAAAGRAISVWPERTAIHRYAEQADAAVANAIATGDIVSEERPTLHRAQAVFASLEHEAMHQETLLYIFHRLPHAQKRRPPRGDVVPGGQPPEPRAVRVLAGTATLGAEPDSIPFGWDNEFRRHVVDVPEFSIDVYNVTNRDYQEFVDAGGYEKRDLWSPDAWAWRTEHDVSHPLFWERRGQDWVWRGMFEDVPLPSEWPVYVSHAEASAYARWKGRRLPTEAEFHRAAYGTASGEELYYPWGDAAPDASRGNFDFRHWDPVPVGSFPAGCSAWGIHDLVGNGWEWTSTIFGPFHGFEPLLSYPEYSADFFDGQHYVMKGASPATARELLRPTFRNWFRPHYPYVYAKFRTVGE